MPKTPSLNAVAAAWYQKAADQGLAQAQHDLGLMYAAGRRLEQDFAQVTKASRTWRYWKAPSFN